MLDYMRETLELMRENLTRTILTLIGLVVGVAAIISIQVAAAGMAAAVNGAFRGINVNTFFLFPKTTQGSTQRANLGLSDLTLLEQNVPGVETAIPFGQTRTIVNAGHQHVMLKFGGESYRRFSTAPVVAGHAITRTDVENASPVCVLSSKAYARLFPHALDPTTVLGQSVYVGPKRYVVAGVLGPATLSTASLGFDINNDVVIPYTTFYNDYQRGRPLFGIQVLGSRDATLATLEANAKRVLSDAHGGSIYQTFDFGFFSKQIDGFFGVVGTIVSAVGAISLLVAGIGIMNILFVSVSERTREIGIRRAIGASRATILIQFFVEAFVLAFSGSLVGMLAGLGIGELAQQLFIARISGTIAALPWTQVILLATLFATVVTLVFGTLPALRAASVDPIEALRYE
uniref:Putative ABC transporter, permease protein n=1 Tax=mine drainage metagenome TaxID=410659 RepID=E6PFQ0_9ZZZZ